MFIRFDRIHEHDKWTDGHRMMAKAALDASIALQKQRFAGARQDSHITYRADILSRAFADC